MHKITVALSKEPQPVLRVGYRGGVTNKICTWYGQGDYKEEHLPIITEIMTMGYSSPGTTLDNVRRNILISELFV